MTRLLSVPEAAARFEVTTQTVRNWINTGRLPALQTAQRGRYRIAQEDLDRLNHEMSTTIRNHPPNDLLRPGLGQGGVDLRPELARVVDAIVAAVEPDAVYLFGSRARGDARSDSDFDLAVVVPDSSQRRRIAMKSYESLASVHHRTVSVDLIVLTPGIIAREGDLVGSVARSVVREGVSVYGSAAI